MDAPDYSQWDPKPQTATGKGGSGFVVDTEDGTSQTCSCNCLDIQIQSVNKVGTLAPSKHSLGLNTPKACVPCPDSQCGRGAGGSGNTEDPPGGASGVGGSTFVSIAGAAGLGNTEDPPQGGTSSMGGSSGIGGNTGETQDPPKGGSTGVGGGSTQDPPQGGSPATGGTTSVGVGGGSTQDPPVGGKTSTGGTSSTGGATGTGGGSTQDPPVGGKSSMGGSPATGGTTSVGVGGGSTQDPPVGGKTSTGGTSSTGGAATGGAATGGAGTGGSTNCGKNDYKFYTDSAEEYLGEGVTTIVDLDDATAAPIVTHCGDASCCFYHVPNSCHRWAVYQTTESEGMPRIPSYNATTNKAYLQWNAKPEITTAGYYVLVSGTDYNLSCNANHECVLILEPHAGEHFYR